MFAHDRQFYTKERFNSATRLDLLLKHTVRFDEHISASALTTCLKLVWYNQKMPKPCLVWNLGSLRDESVTSYGLEMSEAGISLGHSQVGVIWVEW